MSYTYTLYFKCAEDDPHTSLIVEGASFRNPLEVGHQIATHSGIHIVEHIRHNLPGPSATGEMIETETDAILRLV